MSQMSTESMPIKVEVIPVTYLDVRVEGPAGLSALLHVPDGDASYDALESFVAALPQAIASALGQAATDA